jgi:hypothetical protein
MSVTPAGSGDFGVLDGWRYEVVHIVRVSAQCFWYQSGSRERRAYLEKLACWSPTREGAERAAAQLTSAKAEAGRREAAAREWFRERKAQITASAMSAGTAETTEIGSGPQDRQRDPQGDAQHPTEWR